jgi:hypothetical protein
MSKKETEIDYSKHLTPDDWGDPWESKNSKALLIGFIMFILYPLCFISGILVAHFFHW